MNKHEQAHDALQMINLPNLRPNREEAFFIIIIITIIIIFMRDLRVIGINKHEQERISTHLTDNCVQRRVFLLSVMACHHTYICWRDSGNLT